jgi:hypothetical protein
MYLIHYIMKFIKISFIIKKIDLKIYSLDKLLKKDVSKSNATIEYLFGKGE